MSSSRQVLIVEQKAQVHLCAAIFSERSKQWEKAVEHYQMLLRILNRRLFNEHADMKPHYKQLIYETYYHLGVAFQNINQHGKAVLQFSKALQVSSIQKKICTAGCSVATFLHTPVLTRRAFSFARCGENNKALQDAETGVVLDSLNPDVYCVRALVWCTMEREEEAIKDLNYSLRLNPSHVCSLILRGNIQKYTELENNACMTLNYNQEKALQMNHSTLRFLHIKDFNSLHISEFYNSFLWSLNVPHTVISLRCVWPSVQAAPLNFKRISSAPAKQSSALSVVSTIQFSVISAASSTRRANTESLSSKISKMRSMTPSRSHKTSIQKQEMCQKLIEETGFSIFEGGYPGFSARMYNKPWKGDKLPVNYEARKHRHQKNIPS